MSLQETEEAPQSMPRPRARWVRLLLLVPFVAILWVPSYNTVSPMLFGVPFFYWYQLLWIPLAAVLIGIVYWAEN
jgi:uncharacterized membrane protein